MLWMSLPAWLTSIGLVWLSHVSLAIPWLALVKRLTSLLIGAFASFEHTTRLARRTPSIARHAQPMPRVMSFHCALSSRARQRYACAHDFAHARPRRQSRTLMGTTGEWAERWPCR